MKPEARSNRGKRARSPSPPPARPSKAAKRPIQSPLSSRASKSPRRPSPHGPSKLSQELKLPSGPPSAVEAAQADPSRTLSPDSDRTLSPGESVTRQFTPIKTRSQIAPELLEAALLQVQGHGIVNNAARMPEPESTECRHEEHTEGEIVAAEALLKLRSGFRRDECIEAWLHKGFVFGPAQDSQVLC